MVGSQMKSCQTKDGIQDRRQVFMHRIDFSFQLMAAGQLGPSGQLARRHVAKVSSGDRERVPIQSPRAGVRNVRGKRFRNPYAHQYVQVIRLLTLNAPIATKVVYFSHLLKCLRSLYGKQCGPL